MLEQKLQNIHNLGGDDSEGSPTMQLLAEIAEQAYNPPGKDKCIGEFYHAFLEYTGENPHIEKMLREVQGIRNLSPQYLVNLLYRAAQYLIIKNVPLSEIPYQAFRNFNTLEQWLPELRKIFMEDFEQYKKILLERDTMTTKLQRYAGPKAILTTFFGEQKIKVADFGCGGNYGLPGIERGIFFERITDHTRNMFLSQKLNSIVNITGVGIDKYDPNDHTVKTWRIANSFYPKELDQLTDTLALEEKLSNSEKVKFLQADLLQLDEKELLCYGNEIIKPGYFQGVIMSTFCYQLKSSEQKRVFQSARNILDTNGIMIVQDFASKNPLDPNSLAFNQSWFKDQNGYRTFIAGRSTDWAMLEVFQWSDGRCTEVYEGEDFERFLALLSKNPS